MKQLLLIPVLAAGIFLTFSCKSAQNEAPDKVQVHAITLKDTSCIIDYAYPATIKGIQDVAIFPQVNGRITKIRVTEGQYVNTGDVLFEIDDVTYLASYNTALAQVEVKKAQLENSKLTLESKQNLFDREIISKYQLDLAKNQVVTSAAELGQALASLKDAENNLSYTKVRTMGKGYIGSIPFKVGSLVGPQMTEPLTIVSDNSQIYADFSVPENTYLELFRNSASFAEKRAKGDLPELTLITNLGKTYEHPGRIHSISGLISQETGALPIRSVFPNPDKELLSGGSCKVVFKMPVNNVLVVPRAAMKEIQDKLFIFVIREGVLEQVQVNAARLNNSQWILQPNENGGISVKAGDMITSTINKLKNGDPVEIIK